MCTTRTIKIHEGANIQTYQATDCANYSTCAIFTSYKHRYFKESQPATLTTQEALPEKEALFLLLAMIKMEIRRIDLEVGDLAFRPLCVHVFLRIDCGTVVKP